MEIGMFVRLLVAVILAFGGLFFAAYGPHDLHAESVGLGVLVLAILYGYRQVKSHFDAREQHE